MRFGLSYRESILTVVCDDGLRDAAFDAMMEARYSVESKIAEDPFFGITYDPYPASPGDDELVRRMCDASVIAGVGPMAGVGDALFLNIIRIVAAGVTIPMAELGNPLAPILFLIICNIPNLICRYYGLFLGYTLGTSFLEKMYREGTMEAVLKAASIIGLTVIGCTVATSVNFSTSLAINFGENAYALQTVFDSIFQGILPLSITLGCFYLARVKKVGINMLLVGIILFSILCAVLHIA